MTAAGQIPYRDFTWQYPPLGIFAPAFAVMLFGDSMITFYAMMTLTALAVTFIIYRVCRLFGRSELISLLWTIAFVGSSNVLTTRIIGSVGVYTPSWLAGLFGLVLVIWGSSILLLHSRKSGGVLIALGVATTLLSKQEFLVAALAPFLLLIVVGVVSKNRPRRSELRFAWLKYASIGVALALAAYFVLAFITGFENLADGLGGYGQGTEVPARYGPMAVELLRSLAGSIAIGMILVIGVNVYRSNPQRSLLLTTASIVVLIPSLSLAAELISRNQIALGAALYFVTLLIVAGMEITRRSSSNLAKRDSLFSLSSLRPLLVLVASIAVYELIKRPEGGHELLLMAPIRLSPWIVIVATIGFAWHLSTSKGREFANDRQYLTVFAISGFAAGMQARFVIDAGSPPEYSTAVLASLFIVQFISVRKFPKIVHRLVPAATNMNVPTLLLVGAVVPTIAFVAIGKPMLNFVRNDPTLVSTVSGSFFAKQAEAPTINSVNQAVLDTTPDGSPIISTSFTSWVNYITDRPGLLPITQTQILIVNQKWIDESIEVLNGNPPALIIEELINDDGTEYGGWSTNSRAQSPWLWDFIETNYDYCAKFADGDPRTGLWGARFYVQKTPANTAPNCTEFKTKTGFEP